MADETKILIPLRFEFPKRPVVLGQDGEPYGDVPPNLAKRIAPNPDAWESRQKLLDVKTRDDLVGFLNDCGYAAETFQGPEGPIKIRRHDEVHQRTTTVTFDGAPTGVRSITETWTEALLSPKLEKYCFALRDLLRAWMPLRPSHWRSLEGRFPGGLLEYVCFGTGRVHRLLADFGWSEKSAEPAVTVRVSDPLEAIILTVHIDRLRGLRFRTCARVDCGKVFQLVKKYRKRFCCWYCGHLVSVRRQYRKQRRVGRNPEKGRKSKNQTSQRHKPHEH